MTINRLAQPASGSVPNQCPADMPRGKSEAERAARQQFWIERGNRNLDEAGDHHLTWNAKDGFYWIEPR